LNLQFVDFILNILCPLQWRAGLVKCLPGYGFANFYNEGFVAIAKHFVDQVDHCNVELETEKFANIGDAIKLLRISAAKVDRHDVSLGFYTLSDKSFIPGQVAYHTLLLS
jgi:hypothetical protein